MTTLTERQLREKEFYNEVLTPDAYADREEVPYETWRLCRPIVACATKHLGDIRGKRLLQCGVGPEAVIFARGGAEVWGFDISDNQVAAVNRLAERCGLASRVHLEVRPFESMSHPDGFFDLAWGLSILHHIELPLGGRELYRVLRPGGKASFIEPLAENPLLEFARKHLPYREKQRTVDENPLSYSQIHDFIGLFPGHELREFYFVSMLERRVIANRKIVNGLYKLDDVILRGCPPLRRFCSQICIWLQR